jgi:tetratricopeptide (TPR) repeat protein
MSRLAVRLFLLAVLLLTFSKNQMRAEESTSRPLRASEVMALQAGGALGENLAYHIHVRGLKFQPSAEFIALMKTAGAQAVVIEALSTAKVSASAEAKPDMKLLGQLSEAAVLIKKRQYPEAGQKLSEALEASFARLETGFVMATLLQRENEFEKAAAVYAQILETQPDFPEVHDKASYALYRLGDDEDAYKEAKTALQFNPQDAEAHQNAALALSDAHKFDAAELEFKESLRIKPDLASAHSGLGLLHSRMHSHEEAIAEYKKAIALDPDYPNAHYNLGISYVAIGKLGAAVEEYREAKRLNPFDPAIRQNLSSVLMDVSPREAIVELKEMEAKFPNFEMCHFCLGNALLTTGDFKGAEQEYRTAIKLDPADPDPHGGLGDIQERQKNYDAALQEFKIAQSLDPERPNYFMAAGRVLLTEKKYAAAVEEFSQAEKRAPSRWEIHELYGKAALENQQTELAISELREALALDPKQGQVMTELGGALEKKGDWVGALEQYRKGALTDAERLRELQSGQVLRMYDPDPQKAYAEAKARFADHLVSLKAAGQKEDAAELEKRVTMLDTSASTVEKVQLALQAGDRAFKETRMEDAEKSFKEAVQLAQDLPPGDDNLIAAWGRLGNMYALRKDYASAEAAYHHQLAIIEKTFGPFYPRMTEPLRLLGGMAINRKDWAAAESYFSRALEVNIKAFGENSIQTADSLRSVAVQYMLQNDWGKAEPFLLRALKASEAATGSDNNLTLIPLWGLCELYDRWGKPEKSQPCWHRATGIMETDSGQESADLVPSLTSEAAALRKLGKTTEAEQVEKRIGRIQQVAAQVN